MTGSLLLYHILSRTFRLIAKFYLRARLRRGKEHPQRWREKLGEASMPRPKGRLIWLNAVGLGEVLALRGLIDALAVTDPDLSFLITSSGQSSAQVLAENMPPRTRHQFLPLDAPTYVRAFLDHWQPDLSIWVEQELWPNAVFLTAQRQVPLIYLNARLTERGAAQRAKFGGLYAAVLTKFSLITAQDDGTAQSIQQFGLPRPLVAPSLKRAAPALAFDLQVFTDLSAALAGRKPWLVASSHLADETVALAAHMRHLMRDPSALLVIVPRDPLRGTDVAQAARDMGLKVGLRSTQPEICDDVQVYIADKFGELGIWYRLCAIALIGGTFCHTEGHNPWEAAKLGAAILHGPRYANFENDFALLHANKAALCISPQDIDTQLSRDHSDMAKRALGLAQSEGADLRSIAAQVLGYLR